MATRADLCQSKRPLKWLTFWNKPLLRYTTTKLQKANGQTINHNDYVTDTYYSFLPLDCAVSQQITVFTCRTTQPLLHSPSQEDQYKAVNPSQSQWTSIQCPLSCTLPGKHSHREERKITSFHQNTRRHQNCTAKMLQHGKDHIEIQTNHNKKTNHSKSYLGLKSENC